MTRFITPTRTLAAAAVLAFLPVAALAQTPWVYSSNDPAMAGAIGGLIDLTARANGAGSGTGAHVGQTGSGNAAGIGQTGPNNRGVIVQQGCNNTGTIQQTGSNQSLGIFQFGCGHSMHGSQTGSNQATMTVQWN